MCRLLAVLLFACGCLVASDASASKSQTVPITDADQVEINVPMSLKVMQGDQESLVINADDHDMHRLRIRQEGDVLNIEMDSDDDVFFTNHNHIVGTLTIKKLTALHLNSAGKVTIEPFKADRLELAISGAGSMDLTNVTASILDMAIAGTGEIDATGKADVVNVEVSGIGAASLADLACKTSRVSISGGGSVRVFASDELDASISGLGAVRYRGNPHITRAVSGIGTISPATL